MAAPSWSGERKELFRVLLWDWSCRRKGGEDVVTGLTLIFGSGGGTGVVIFVEGRVVFVLLFWPETT